MIINKVFYEKAFNEFGFWDNKIKENYHGSMSAISLEVTNIYENEEFNLNTIKYDWVRNISKIIEKNGLRLFLILYIPYSNPVSKLQEYKKLWGNYKDLNNFIIGEQISLKCNSGVLYCGATSFEINEIAKAIDFISEIPFSRTIVATKHNLLEKESIYELFYEIMHKNMQSKLDVKAYHLDFGELCNIVCKKGGVVFRVVDVCEEESITVFFDNNYFKGFSNYF